MTKLIQLFNNIGCLSEKLEREVKDFLVAGSSIAKCAIIRL